ncbi:signal peptidase II [Pseudomonadota bacterium]
MPNKGASDEFESAHVMQRWLWLAVVVIVLDQATKFWAVAALYEGMPVTFFTGLDFTLSYNPGAAFSFLADAGGWQRWFFTVLALGVSVFIIGWVRKLQSYEKGLAVALALILGGALGNVVDRIYLGEVVDFIDVYYLSDSCVPFFGQVITISGGSCHWPAFNIADSAIFLGAVLMVFDSFRHQKNKSDI